MIIRSKAPLRISLAGGGTDVSPYSEMYGGAILNATINMYAHATIVPRTDGNIIIHSIDKNTRQKFKATKNIAIDETLDLHKGIYNHIVHNFTKKPLSFELTTFIDAPAGSGLGTSSTLVVAIIGAFVEWLKLPLGEYDIAHLAYQIERNDLKMAGGKQDQYAAAFGGFNFMEFYDNNKVIVNPLRIKETTLYELENNLVLYYTDVSRLSSKIIEQQQKNVKTHKRSSVEAMHRIKEQAIKMKEALLKGELNAIGKILNNSWNDKKKMADGISNHTIETIYKTALKAGATGGKISGAGGGGFLIFYCQHNTRYNVINAISQLGGQVRKFEFTMHGLKTWTIIE